jgi:hypothetical protein
VPENIQFSFSCSFFLPAQSVWGPWSAWTCVSGLRLNFQTRMFHICRPVYIAVQISQLGLMELLSTHASLAETREGDNDSDNVCNHLQHERIMLYTLDSFTILHRRCKPTGNTVEFVELQTADRLCTATSPIRKFVTRIAFVLNRVRMRNARPRS